MKHTFITFDSCLWGGGGGPGTLRVLADGHLERLFLPVADSCWDG